jgi:hypothetical protein
MQTQRNSKNLGALVLLCATLVLRADSCLVEQKDISMVLAGEIPAEWVSQGWTEANFSDTDIVQAGEDVGDALDADDTEGEVTSIQVVGAIYEVLESTGHDARRAGTVTVNGNLLLTFDVPSNATGVKGAAGDGTLTLEAPGLTFVNNRMQQYLDSYNAGIPNPALLDFTYVAQWTSTPAPSSGDPDDFRWRTDLVIQIEKTVTVDVPDF